MKKLILVPALALSFQLNAQQTSPSFFEGEIHYGLFSNEDVDDLAEMEQVDFAFYFLGDQLAMVPTLPERNDHKISVRIIFSGDRSLHLLYVEDHHKYHVVVTEAEMIEWKNKMNEAQLQAEKMQPEYAAQFENMKDSNGNQIMLPAQNLFENSVTSTDEQEIICGVNCSKTIVKHRFTNYEIMTTGELNINPAVTKIFAMIPDQFQWVIDFSQPCNLPLKVTMIKKYNDTIPESRFGLLAKSVSNQKPSAGVFEFPKGYKQLTLEKFFDEIRNKGSKHYSERKMKKEYKKYQESTTVGEIAPAPPVDVIEPVPAK